MESVFIWIILPLAYAITRSNGPEQCGRAIYAA